ncbi:MAG: dihydropteroate synthase [Wenzhouxiangella sp.]|nr:dihydropteroate synthase [Wenzhouxiangella sp.]
MGEPLAERIGRAHRIEQPLVMGVVNVTPDSFSDGGRFDGPEQAVEHALALLDQGADLLDVGGESTRPGAEPVSEAAELARVLPVIERLRQRSDAPISIDSTKPAVMRAAVAAGADMINDVNALRAPGALQTAAELAVPVCIMHMQGDPLTMQDKPDYGDVVADVLAFFSDRVQACLAAGIAREHLVLDPGFGFGKTLAHNLTLLARFRELNSLGYPVLAGLSRKSMLGRLTGRERPDERLAASVTAAVLAAQRGAALVRVHDVAATVDGLKIWLALAQADAENGSES